MDARGVGRSSFIRPEPLNADGTLVGRRLGFRPAAISHHEHFFHETEGTR